MRRLLGYLRPELPGLLGAWACMAVLAATTAAMAFLSGPALTYVFTGSLHDLLYAPGGALRPVWQVVPPALLARAEALAPAATPLLLPVLVVVVAALKGGAQCGQSTLMGRASQRVLRALRRDAFAALLRQPPAFFARRAHGDLLSRLSSDCNTVEQALYFGAASVVRDGLAVLALLAGCLFVDPRLALFILVSVPLAVAPLARFAAWLKQVAKRGQGAQGDINAVCYEALSGVRVVQAFGNEGRELARLDVAAARYYRQMRRSYFLRAVRTPTMETMGAVALAAMLLLLGRASRREGADPAQYVSFFAAIVMMYDPLKKLGAVSDYLAAGASAAERLLELIDLPPTIVDAPDARPVTGLRRDIVFEQVDFSYGHGEVLGGIDLTLGAGEVVALVGPSGAGKSSLAALLPRFYDPTAGRICLDGVDLRALRLADLRQQMGIVAQEAFLFRASVADNIAYGRPGAPRAAIEAAAEAAHAAAFIAALPQGYDTVLGERGVTLSGGQRQRLAIARALLRDAPLLILDEATSSLDVDSERAVQAALARLLTNRTALVIAHRLSTVRRADRIVVLEAGRIVESGNHAALLRHDGAYARLCALDAAGGLRDGPSVPAAGAPC